MPQIPTPNPKSSSRQAPAGMGGSGAKQVVGDSSLSGAVAKLGSDHAVRPTTPVKGC